MKIASSLGKGPDVQEEDIHKAIRKLDVEKIESIIQSNRDVLYNRHPIPLSYACKLGNLTSVKAILPYMSSDMNDVQVFSIFQECFLYAHQLGHEKLIHTLEEFAFRNTNRPSPSGP